MTTIHFLFMNEDFAQIYQAMGVLIFLIDYFVIFDLLLYAVSLPTLFYFMSQCWVLRLISRILSCILSGVGGCIIISVS